MLNAALTKLRRDGNVNWNNQAWFIFRENICIISFDLPDLGLKKNNKTSLLEHFDFYPIKIVTLFLEISECFCFILLI